MPASALHDSPTTEPAGTTAVHLDADLAPVAARAQRRTVTAALHRGPVLGVAWDDEAGDYRLVVNLH